jgi:hypothetical protein
MTFLHTCRHHLRFLAHQLLHAWADKALAA